MSKKSKATISFVMSVICFIVAFVTIPASKSFEPTKITMYSVDGNHISGENKITHISDGYTSGQPKLLEISNIVFWIGLITGVILLIYAIYCLVTSAESECSVDDTFKNPMFIDCSNCGEANTAKNEYCFKCYQRISSRPISHSTGNKWYCPTCGKENQNYVGTCGCGTRKP